LPAALPPDVLKASGLPKSSKKELWATPRLAGQSPNFDGRLPETQSASAHQAAQPHFFSLAA
jgi:hypothetical protein